MRYFDEDEIFAMSLGDIPGDLTPDEARMIIATASRRLPFATRARLVEIGTGGDDEAADQTDLRNRAYARHRDPAA